MTPIFFIRVMTETQQEISNGVQSVSIKETALGLNREVTESEVLRYILSGQYEVRRTGSKGAELSVRDDDGYQILASIFYNKGDKL